MTERIEDVLQHGAVVRHLHNITIVLNNKRVELLYEDGKVKSAQLVRDNGFDYLNEVERLALAEFVSDYLDTPRVATY